MSNFKAEEISTLKVSVRTARYVNIKDCLCVLWAAVEDTLEKDYGEQTAASIFKACFEEPLIKIGREVDDLLISAIGDNMANDKRTEVL